MAKLKNINLIEPKHIQAGKSVGLHMAEKGESFITVSVLNESQGLSENVEFLIDTGFNGYLQLAEDIAERLKLDIIKKDKTKGFDGVEKEIGIATTKVKLINSEISNFPIQVVKNGVCLIGTRFLKDTWKMLIMDYRNNVITITEDKKVQKKVHKAVNKYAL